MPPLPHIDFHIHDKGKCLNFLLNSSFQGVESMEVVIDESNPTPSSQQQAMVGMSTPAAGPATPASSGSNLTKSLRSIRLNKKSPTKQLSGGVAPPPPPNITSQVRR